MVEVAGVELLDHVGCRAGDDVDARSNEAAHTRACDPRIWVLDADDHAFDAGLDQRIHTRWGPSVVAAGLEGDVDRAALRVPPGSGERHDLRMGTTRPLVGALAGHRAITSDHDGADARIRMRVEGTGDLDRASQKRLAAPVVGSVVGARASRHSALLLPSGLSPSVPEFHRVHP